MLPCLVLAGSAFSASAAPTERSPSDGVMLRGLGAEAFPQVPRPYISAKRIGTTLVVSYRFMKFPSVNSAGRPYGLSVSADPAGERFGPRTEEHRVRATTGTIRQPIGAGHGPYTIRVQAVTARGFRSPFTLAIVP